MINANIENAWHLNSHKNFQQDLDILLLESTKDSGSENYEIIKYHLEAGGSRNRAKIAFSIAQSLGINDGQSYLCAACVEALHNASLVHDDLQDNDAFRRDRPAIWQKFGKNTAISIGDLLISSSFYFASKLQTDQIGPIIEKIHQSLSVTVQGQGYDLKRSAPNFQNNGPLSVAENLSFDDYLTIAENKSAPLFALSCEVAFLYKNMKDAALTAKQAGIYFAVAYQLLDDYCDRDRDKEIGEFNAFNIIEKFEQNPKNRLYKTIISYLDKSSQCNKDLPTQTTHVLLNYIEQLRQKTKGLINDPR